MLEKGHYIADVQNKPYRGEPQYSTTFWTMELTNMQSTEGAATEGFNKPVIAKELTKEVPASVWAAKDDRMVAMSSWDKVLRIIEISLNFNFLLYIRKKERKFLYYN